jgi:hypothetical protein
MVRNLFQRLFGRASSGGSAIPSAQLEFLKDFLSRHKYVFTQDFEENLVVLKRKHVVDSFLVTNLDGSIIVSSDGNGHTDGIMGTAMLSYIKSELPDSESVLIKRNGSWFMLFPLNKKVFIVRAGSELTNIELKALAFELDGLLTVNKQQLDKKKIHQIA